jgi:hypothetical protein
VYGAVPSEGLAVSISDCPVSINGLDGVIAPAVRAALTVTVTPEEQDEIEA